MIPRQISKNAYDRIFQYKILNNTLFLNKKLYLFGKTESSLCSFCGNVDEDLIHLFANCPETLSLWDHLKANLSSNLLLAELEDKFALLGFYEAATEHFNLENHILLLFKIYIYQSRSRGSLRINDLMKKITDTAKLELSIHPTDTIRQIYYQSKWRPLNGQIQDP